MKHARDTPFPAEWLVERARNAYFQENGFSFAAYDEPRTEGSFLGFRFTVPNPPRHRWAIMLHDLHHVATGYGTNPAGEGEIAAWELRRGLRPLGLYTGLIASGALLLGLIVAPRRVLRAWRDSGAGRRSLFHDRSRSYDQLVSLSTAALPTIAAYPRRRPGAAAARSALDRSGSLNRQVLRCLRFRTDEATT